LAFLALPLVAQTSYLTALGHWSAATLRTAEATTPAVAAIALVVLVVCAALAVRAARSRIRALRSAFRLAGGLQSAGELAVLDDAARTAFAVPGRPGRIVVTSGMLRELSAPHRRALLAHERSHLRHHHYLHETGVAVATAVNPLLRRLPSAVRLSCERWADEDAAALERRDTTADALVHAALGPLVAVPHGIFAAAATEVEVRVAALRAPVERMHAWRLLLLVAVLAAAVGAALDAAYGTDQLFDLAKAVYRARQR
jgi:Zn-dependent protease with chaperone function